jgi:hypothetical protein
LEPKPGTRAKSEKRQTTREKKQLIKDLNWFLTKHESRNLTQDSDANQLEEMIEKLKNCFLYTDGEVIEQKEMFDSLEEWICLEDSASLINLYLQEIKEEMEIRFLVGLEDAVEHVVPEADEAEEIEFESSKLEKSDLVKPELDIETAMELASTIKATAVKLFENGNILGELAVKLDEASDSVFRLLRRQRVAEIQKKEMEKAKAEKKKNLKDMPDVAENDPEAVAHAPPDDSEMGGVVVLGDIGDMAMAV